MPLKGVVKYRYRKLKDGTKQRLAFGKGGKVLEVKNPGAKKAKRVK